MSYSEVTLICKEEGKGGTEYNEESKDGCLKKGGGGKGIEGEGRREKESQEVQISILGK